MPKRKFSSRSRRTKVRDARLIVIATEGRYTEKQYFDALVQYYRNSRIHVEVLATGEDNKSAPGHVLKRLRSFKSTYDLNSDDELWLVIDNDRWGNLQLSQIASDCISAGYGIADSNPAFEIWLLLHFTDLNGYSEAELGKLKETSSSGRPFREQELVRYTGSFSKSNLNSEKFIPTVEDAIKHAKQLDTSPSDRWLQSIGSRVYRVVRSILDKSKK